MLIRIFFPVRGIKKPSQWASRAGPYFIKKKTFCSVCFKEKGDWVCVTYNGALKTSFCKYNPKKVGLACFCAWLVSKLSLFWGICESSSTQALKRLSTCQLEPPSFCVKPRLDMPPSLTDRPSFTECQPDINCWIGQWSHVWWRELQNHSLKKPHISVEFAYEPLLHVGLDPTLIPI